VLHLVLDHEEFVRDAARLANDRSGQEQELASDGTASGGLLRRSALTLTLRRFHAATLSSACRARRTFKSEHKRNHSPADSG
jgi:hypothetical protein